MLALAPDASALTILPCLAYITLHYRLIVKVDRNLKRHRAVLHVIARLSSLFFRALYGVYSELFHKIKIPRIRNILSVLSI